MDLTRQPPRRPSNLGLAGIAGAARMADKARGHEAELIGAFKYGDESGLDREILAFINMTADEFAEQAAVLGDEELSVLVRQRAGRSQAEIDAFNQEHLEREPQDQLHRDLLQQRLAQYAPGRTDITTVFASIELDDWGAFRQLDLTRRPPRTPYLRTVAGVVGAARMADKARAVRCGQEGEYNYGRDSGTDELILDFLGLEADAFLEAAYQNPNDTELGEWVQTQTQRPGPEILAFNAELSARGKYPPVRERFLRRRAEICPTCEGVETWFDLIDHDDQHSFGIVDLTRRPPRSPYDRSLGGIYALARMVDKGRAALSDHLGSYWYGEDSGVDRGVLAYLGLSADAFLDGLRQHADDDGLVAWLGERLERPASEREGYNREMASSGPSTEAQRAALRHQVGGLDRTRTDITTWFGWMQLEDRVTFTRLKAGV